MSYKKNNFSLYSNPLLLTYVPSEVPAQKAKELPPGDDWFDNEPDSDDDEGIPMAIPCAEEEDVIASKNSYVATMKKRGLSWMR